jgi:hypothetical protein
VFLETILGNFTIIFLHIYVVIKVHYCVILYYANKRQFFLKKRKMFMVPSVKMIKTERISKQAVYKILIHVNINLL